MKLQISACTVIAYMHMATKEVDKPPTEADIINSVSILALLNICPVMFYVIVSRNFDKLGNEDIKAKIGTLYNGLRANKPNLKTYPLVFLLRRSLFVALTFILFDYPGVQVQLMIYMTLIYLIYIGHCEFFETRGAKSLEILNESIFVLI